MFLVDHVQLHHYIKIYIALLPDYLLGSGKFFFFFFGIAADVDQAIFPDFCIENLVLRAFFLGFLCMELSECCSEVNMMAAL